ncbi:hypothetical protein HJG52_05255 [Knoellia sp. DB2414S]|uniref:Uncharacterized protein n=1 Tax=Knoellia koreensis TaxID=2730921 RepID=A0A849HDN7_9MICO|nr:hypothetical protein [Knoellia sp. DB2414S]
MAVAVVLTGVTAGGLAGCSGDEAGSGCTAPVPADAAALASLPQGLDLSRLGTVTEVVDQPGSVVARGVTKEPLERSTVLIQDALVAAGYEPGGMDNEGFEAEVFFTKGSYAAGQAVLRRGTCEGQWTFELTTVDPAAATSSR